MAIEIIIVSQNFEMQDEPKRLLIEKDDITIGRSDSAEVRVDDDSISTAHARVRVVEDILTREKKLYVSDLASATGTFLNERRLGEKEELLLGTGGRIRLGNFWIKASFVAEEDAKELDPNVSLDALPRRELGTSIEGTTKDEELSNPAETICHGSNGVEVASTSQSEKKSSLHKVLVSENGSNRYDFQAIKIITLSGTVRDEEGLPLTDVAVSCISESDSFEAHTDADGNVSFFVPENQCIELICRHPEYLFAPLTLNLEGENAIQTVEILGRELITLTGRILANGIGVEGVQITANGTNYYSNEEGTFAIEGLTQNDDLTLSCLKDGYLFEEETVTVSLESTRSVEINARRLLTVTGTVEHQGIKLAGVTVCSENFGMSITDEDGRYLFENVPDGTTLSLRIEKEGFVFKHSGTDIMEGQASPLEEVDGHPEEGRPTVSSFLN